LCGDVARPRLGLSPDEWDRLSTEVDAVVHNAALVNYVLNYDALKPHNVDGTRELLQFSFARRRKTFHFISSTIVFGWTSYGVLAEAETNDSMSALDFGYSQTKWVAEQLVLSAEKQGLDVRIYRPAFISPSSDGAGSRSDIAILLIAFMINHGIAVRSANQVSFLPADHVADNVARLCAHGTAGQTYHVTTGGYHTMMDITRVLTVKYGYRFRYFDIPEFVAEIRRRCTERDGLYPLLNFIERSHAKVAVMQHKRYHNEHYAEAVQRTGGREEPRLDEVVSYLVAYMRNERLISTDGTIPPSARANPT
jgi:thioester reductase-like protein